MRSEEEEYRHVYEFPANRLFHQFYLKNQKQNLRKCQQWFLW